MLESMYVHSVHMLSRSIHRDGVRNRVGRISFWNLGMYIACADTHWIFISTHAQGYCVKLTHHDTLSDVIPLVGQWKSATIVFFGLQSL